MEKILNFPKISTTKFSTNYNPPDVKIGGFYSIDYDRNFIDGPKLMKFCQGFDGIKNVNYDLNDGLNLEKTMIHEKEFIPKRREENSRLIHLLKWIQLHQAEFEEQRPNFVTLRGLLKVILVTPYHEDENSKSPDKRDWAIGAIKKNGTIYLRYIKNEETVFPDRYKPRWLTAIGRGAKFEDFLLSDEPKFISYPSSQKSKSISTLGSECRAILRTKIGKHNILYCAELDGVFAHQGMTDPNDNTELRMIELKTTRKFHYDKMEDQIFRRQSSLRWWAQSVLGGVSNIVVGYRSYDGIVQEIENIPTNDLHKRYAKDWYAETGFKFLDLFLTKVKKTVKEDNKVYVFSYSPNNKNNLILETSTKIQLKLKVEENSDNFLTNLV